MEEFQNKVAFITGAASGIGLGLARTFARAGMKVAMADVRAKVLDAAAAGLAAEGATVLPIPLDVTDRVAWARAGGAPVQQRGREFHRRHA
jgi:NADP-dependent 3-hydroxy acid dehydrogenase YdfG